MKLYVTASFKNAANKSDIELLCSLLKQAGFEDFCFIRDVENYQKVFDDPKELMESARKELINSDALLLDMTDKSTGRAIEAGIAFALEKKIILIAKRGTSIKDTSKGIADLIFEYDRIEDIVEPLKEWLSTN